MSNFKIIFLGLVLAAGVAVPGAAIAGSTVAMSPTPYSSEGMIPGNVIAECTKLGTQLADFVKAFADKAGSPVELKSEVDFATEPSALRIEIVNLVSAGNPFVGHNKSMTIKVDLMQNGEVKASTTLARNSMGGMFAGYKGSCSVLARVTKALGKDTAAWLIKQ